MNWIAKARFARYLRQADNDSDEAIALYRRNIELSAAFYPVVQGVELTLRNSLDKHLIEKYGDEWWARTDILKRTDKRNVEKVKSRLMETQRRQTHNDIVADLGFAFWVGLLDRKYDDPLWRDVMYTAFPNYGAGLKRQTVFERLNSIRDLRNRIMHHEPIIFDDSLKELHENALEAIGWMSEEAEQWYAEISRVGKILDSVLK